jgi:hypothetical protein
MTYPSWNQGIHTSATAKSCQIKPTPSAPDDEVLAHAWQVLLPASISPRLRFHLVSFTHFANRFNLCT